VLPSSASIRRAEPISAASLVDARSAITGVYPALKFPCSPQKVCDPIG
jgi:hypothetical protein